jgi:DNA-directed DNA polymerase III PolC
MAKEVRNPNRSIIHLDADAFFASVEQSTDPRLRGKAVAVGGEKRGIIASASYEARKFGIFTPMPTVLARRLCPKLILLPGDFEKYEFFSRLMFSYAYDFTPDVEIGSIDEGYFDLTGARKPALSIAETIRHAIRQSLKLSVSEGVGSNKLISQIASKLNKPDAFQFVPTGQEAQFLSNLANKWLPGVGPKTANQLNAAGLARIGQIGRTPVDLLHLLVGNMAPQLRNFALGMDERPVVPARAPAKSYGEQQTFAADTTDAEFLEATLRRMADKLMAKVREDGKSVRTLAVKVRYNDMDEEMACESLNEPTDLETEVYSTVSKLLRKSWRRRVSLRLVSLRLSNLYDGRFRSALALDIPSRQHDAQQRLADVVDELRHKFGRAAIFRGHDFILRAKKERGEEPFNSGGNATRDDGRKPLSSPPTPAISTRAVVTRTSTPAEHTGSQLKESPLPYHLAVVQRQRIGAYANRHPPTTRPMPPPPIPSRARSVQVTPSIPSIPLNIHSYFSFLDSTLSIEAIIALAKSHKLPAIALTDTNNLHGAIEFAQAAAREGIKPIIGVELASKSQRLCLYVQNQTGYHNLCRILNAQGRRSDAKNPKGEDEPELLDTRFPTLPALSCTDGLLALSPSAEFASFFPDRFYLEINSLETFEKQKRATPLPCIASFPVHYAQPSERWKYNIVQSIRTLTLLRQEHPQKRLTGDFHFRTPVEMQKLFADEPGLLTRSLEIAERCAFAFNLGKPQFPSYSPVDGSSPAAFLRRLVMEGLQRRYPKNHACLQAQLDEELAIITEVGYEEYFLVMWDILQECRRRGIDWITRGSAADSLACYCLEISGVCPIRFDLYFRRFLNKDRMALNKLPDIDIDFPHDRKDDVVDLIFEKYGAQQAAIVGSFSTFQSRSAFAEVAKVLGVSDYQARRITERLPHYSRASDLTDAVAVTQECRDLPLEEDPYRTALQMAHFLDGFPRYPKMHPCGLVLSRQPMDEIVPRFISAKDYPTTHFDMDSVEAAGLIKMDILAQGGLAVMRDVKEMLEKASISTPPSAPLDLAALEPWDDPRVWEMIATGQARAVHHIESPAMISLCKMCNVRDIDTLIAIVSVIRPGAANESKKMEFARRYQGLSPVRYPHPSLATCLHSTYGLVVYEEHILQICEAFAGLPPGRADVLRRALGKEKNEIIAQIKIEFAECARRRDRTEAKIAEVWELVAGFKGYAFCKAHSTAYGVEAYQSAWLKLNYPAQFMAAVLTNGKGFYDPLVYVLESHRLGIPLLPPFINEPGPHFMVTTEQQSPKLSGHQRSPRVRIRVPVLNVKGLTTRTKETILRERARGEFASLRDFFLRVEPLNEEMEALIQVGAFDNFGKPRAAQYWEFKSICQIPIRTRSASPPKISRFQTPAPMTPPPPPPPAPSSAQLWLFTDSPLERLPSLPLAEPDRLQRLRWEESLLGYPASGHPLELYSDIAWDTYCPINRLGEHCGEQIVTCGLVIEQRLFHQVTGEPMKFITIADWTGVVETELFARTYKTYGLTTIRYPVLEITATVEPFESGLGFTLRVLRAAKPRTKTSAGNLLGPNRANAVRPIDRIARKAQAIAREEPQTAISA